MTTTPKPETPKQIAKTMKRSGELTLDVLLLAKRLIAKAGGWTKGAMGRSGKGTIVGYESRAAVSFCSVGAVYRAQKELNAFGAFGVRPHPNDLLRECIPHGRNIMLYNDAAATKKADVLKMFSCAIDKRRKQLKARAA